MEELILVRDGPNDPWGFRLTGGKNFGTPLTVVKVTGGGIAESAGVQVGDMVMEINNEETANFSHSDAQKAIINAGDHLILTILRGSPVELPVTPLRSMTPVSRPQSTITVTLDHVENLLDPNIVPSDADVVLVKNSVANRDAPVDKPYPEAPKQTNEPTEEEIAELMLENAEVIDDYHVIGVNFQRFVPKCDFIKNSLVFQALQDEAIRKEKSEEEILTKCPDKRFSTFLVQPNRPKPIVKILLKDKEKTSSKEKSSNDSKRKEDGGKEVEESKTDRQPEEGRNEEKSEEKIIETPEVKSDAEPTLESTSIPDLSTNKEITDKDSMQITEELVTALENIIDGNVKEDEENVSTKEKGKEGEVEEKQTQLNNVSSELSEFDRQLAQIQSQLASISILPTEIQSHLNQVQEQINKLLELKNNTGKQATSIPAENESCTKEETLETENQENIIEDTEKNLDTNLESINSNLPSEELRNEDQAYDYDQFPEEDGVSEPEEEYVRRKKWSIPREKPSFPLTPCLRPMVLPGGRKWKSPKDAYSEAFITETLVSQAEVLVGTTIGVNFRKYEPAKVDMSHSPTWRLLHNVEEPSGGIANRPERIPADCEFMEPIHARHFYVANLTINPDVTSSLTNQPEPSNQTEA